MFSRVLTEPMQNTLGLRTPEVPWYAVPGHLHLVNCLLAENFKLVLVVILNENETKFWNNRILQNRMSMLWNFHSRHNLVYTRFPSLLSLMELCRSHSMQKSTFLWKKNMYTQGQLVCNCVELVAKAKGVKSFPGVSIFFFSSKQL